MNAQDIRLARWSLIAVWLWTALVSIQQMDGMSRTLLAADARIPPDLYGAIIWAGALVDAALGLLMAFRPSRRVYLSALAMTLLMTLVGTVIDPTLWLHPLGPMSKNLPILVLLWMLARATPNNRSHNHLHHR